MGLTTVLNVAKRIKETLRLYVNEQEARILTHIREFAAIGLVLSLALVVPCATGQTFTLSPLTGFNHPVMEALLYNPPAAEVTLTYPYKHEPKSVKLLPTLVLDGKGLPEGNGTLTVRIEDRDKLLFEGGIKVSVASGGMLVQKLTFPDKYPDATRVSYVLTYANGAVIRGSVPLRWSRFRGEVRYKDGGWRSTFIFLHPELWLPGFYVPVMKDGHFDALVPSRIYSMVNVSGTGYGYDSLERWAWDYDLTRDREDVFTIGRTELYSIQAFDVKGGPPTIFVIFRPTALSRVLRFGVLPNPNGNGVISNAAKERMEAAMKKSPTAIGPELRAKDVEVWLDGRQQKIVQFNKVPEYDGGNVWQVQYLLQFYPDRSPRPFVWHEIKLEVRSKETLHGKEIIDFGQGSVGFYRQ